MLNTSQPPHHKARHRRVDEGLSGSAKPFVILAHPPVLAQHANVRSTTQRRGNTTNPRRGNSFSQSGFTPSFAHSSAHRYLARESAWEDGERSRRSNPGLP